MVEGDSGRRGAGVRASTGGLQRETRAGKLVQSPSTDAGRSSDPASRGHSSSDRGRACDRPATAVPAGFNASQNRALRKSPWAAPSPGTQTGARSDGQVQQRGRAAPGATGARSVSVTRSTSARRIGPNERTPPARTPSPATRARSSSADSNGTGRAASPGALRRTGTGRGGCAAGSATWRPAGSCLEILGLLGPLRETLLTALGLPRVSFSTSLPRLGPGGAPIPPAREVRRVRELCSAVQAAAGAVLQLLDQTSRIENQTAMPTAHSWSSPGSETNSTRSEPNLEHTERELRSRMAQLEEPASRALDLERVVFQLRARVAELEERESRISALRDECSRLRGRITELVASAIDGEQLERQRGELQTRLAELEQGASSQAECGSEQVHSARIHRAHSSSALSVSANEVRPSADSWPQQPRYDVMDAVRRQPCPGRPNWAKAGVSGSRCSASRSSTSPASGNASGQSGSSWEPPPSAAHHVLVVESGSASWL